MAKTETNVTNLKINRGTYANIQANISSIGENELIITTDKNIPVPTQQDVDKIVRVDNTGEYYLDDCEPLTDAEVINALDAYPIDLTITNGTYTGSPYVLGTTTIGIAPWEGFGVPAQVTVNGTTGTSGSTGVTWNYNPTSGIITLTSATGDVAISATCIGALPEPKASLADYTWLELKALSEGLVDGRVSTSDLSSTYHIVLGNTTRAATINNESHTYRLIGINHDVDADGNTLGMTFEQTDLMANYYNMKYPMTSTDSWQNSTLKTTLEGFAVDSDLATVITPAKKVCANNVSSGTPTYDYINTENGLWIESETEIFGSQTYTIDRTVEGSRYAYYTNGGDTRKTRGGSDSAWYARSPRNWNGSKAAWAGVSKYGEDGVYEGANSSDHTGVCPCFCI